MDIEVKQCMGCFTIEVTHDGQKQQLAPEDRRIVASAELCYCASCANNANMLVKMYADLFGYACA